MITPTKGIAPDRALLAVGAQILLVLDEPRTVSRAWTLFRERRKELNHFAPVSFEWFTLGLDVLYTLGLVDMRRDLIVAVRGGEDTRDAA